ncbi:MAG: hypothetical protein H0U44_05970 [Flavisolibacter sp.]|nr:hypothetical protein [Flavisolibacter sp.]
MNKMKTKLIITLIAVALVVMGGSCQSDKDYEPVPTSPVVIDLTAVPYPKLSDYKFFEGPMKDLTPSIGVLAFKPASELFSDMAIKKRFIWMPSGTKASYDGDGNALIMPVGSALINNFYYENVQPDNVIRIIETRLMIRKATGWIFAEYVWNEQQTEAFLQTEGSETAVSWIDEANNLQSIIYKIPSASTDCLRCHGLLTGEINPIGLKPQNLNHDLTYPEGAKNQLDKLIEYGYLENNLPANIVSVVDYKDASHPVNDRVRSYFDSNCAHCHRTGGEGDHFELKLSFNETTINSHMGVGVQAEHWLPGYNGRIVTPGNVSQSILHYRINTETDNFYMMPPLGRTIRDDAAVGLVEQWINSLQ